MCAFNSLRQQNACYRNISWTFAGLLPWYCYAIKTNSRTIHSRLSQHASAGKGRDMSELQAHHFMTQAVNLTLVQCEFHTGKKTAIARIKSVNRNEDADFRFFQICLVLNPNFHGGQMSVLPPLRTPMRSLTILYQVQQTRLADGMKRRNVFD